MSFPPLGSADVIHLLVWRKRSGTSAFSLVELLVVIGILGILLAVTLIAINPSRMFAVTTQARRSSDASVLGKAVEQYLVSAKGVVPTEMYPLMTPKVIARNSGGPEADLCSLLVDGGIVAGLPVDPSSSSSQKITNCALSYNTQYFAIANSSGKIGIYAPTYSPQAPAVAAYGAVPAIYLTPGGPSPTPTGTAFVAYTWSSGISGGTNYARESVLIDIDGDTKLDLITNGNDGGTNVGPMYCLNTGTGTFNTCQAIPGAHTSFISNNVVAYDVDNDGKLDAVFASVVSSGASGWCRNNGSGFDTCTTIGGTGGYDAGVVMVDLNMDGKKDLFQCSRWITSPCSICLHNGSNNFNNCSNLSSSSSFGSGLTAFDTNGDGREDVVTGGGLGVNPKICINDGAGSFSSCTSVPGSNSNFYGARVMGYDINRDGNKDILITTNNGTTTQTCLADGSGGFNSCGSGHVPNRGQLVAFDYNKDGITDVLNGQKSCVHDGSSSLNTCNNLSSATTNLDIAVGDVDNDGDTDIVTSGDVTWKWQ